MITEDYVLTARRIAEAAHAGQTDKAGADYIQHPARVAAAVRGDANAEAVAWLHDVVEDTPVSLDQLRDEGIPEDVVKAVEAITRRQNPEGDAYYARVAHSTRRAKLRDRGTTT